MTPGEPIACDLHDYLEIACLFGYELDIRRRDGSETRGRAADTRIAAGVELLVLFTGLGQIEIPMHDIFHITVRTPHARFRELRLTE